MKRIVVITTALVFILHSCTVSKSKVFLIPTLHGLHKINDRYNYDSLRNTVSVLKPEIIIVEIREEDILEESSYMSKNYPLEMRMMRYWFPGTTIMGFDWLGKDIEGKRIPDEYWNTISEIKKMEKALDADSVWSAKTAICDTFISQRLAILKVSSLKEILQSNDAALTNKYYDCVQQQLKGSIHERILKFYELRNLKMSDNIKSLISKNKNKRIVILTGDDHFAYLKDQFRNTSVY